MPPSAADVPAWDARIARARQLAAERPAVSEILVFYAGLAELQRELARRRLIDIESLTAAVPAWLDFVESHGPPRLAEAVQRLRSVERATWCTRLERRLRGDESVDDTDEPAIFLIETLLQPLAEQRALSAANDDARAVAPSVPARCPLCGDLPVTAVLRPSGQSARQSLACGLCLHEWSWPRIVCPSCGERKFEALAVYRADEAPLVHVVACDSCRTYLKVVDMTVDGRAVPVVDELASVALDLWAREQGYQKLRPNLLRM